MFELTSAQYRFRQAVPEGDFYEALGLSPKATSLDVDVAGSRLAEQVPSMAAEVSRVVNVLTHRQRKTLYDAVRKVRDEVANSLASHYGAEFSRTVPNFRLDLWGRCCRLFRFDLTGDEQKLGKNGRQALAEAGPGWIIRDLLDACVSPGESGRGGSPTFAIVGSVTSAQAPKAVLERFFALQNEGKDVTLKEAEKDLRKRQLANLRMTAWGVLLRLLGLALDGLCFVAACYLPLGLLALALFSPFWSLTDWLPFFFVPPLLIVAACYWKIRRKTARFCLRAAIVVFFFGVVWALHLLKAFEVHSG